MTAIDPEIMGQLAEDLPAATFHRILETFRADLTRLSASYEAGLARGDAGQCQHAAHSLAGAAAAVGAIGVERVARAAMAAQDLAVLRSHGSALRQEAVAALTAMSAWLRPQRA